MIDLITYPSHFFQLQFVQIFPPDSINVKVAYLALLVIAAIMALAPIGADAAHHYRVSEKLILILIRWSCLINYQGQIILMLDY